MTEDDEDMSFDIISTEETVEEKAENADSDIISSEQKEEPAQEEEKEEEHHEEYHDHEENSSNSDTPAPAPAATEDHPTQEESAQPAIVTVVNPVSMPAADVQLLTQEQEQEALTVTDIPSESISDTTDYVSQATGEASHAVPMMVMIIGVAVGAAMLKKFH